MKLQKSYIIDSPDRKGYVRLVGEVLYNNSGSDPELYWYEVPQKYAEYLSTSGNSWLVCLLPLAVKIREPLQICEPIDRVLFENVHELMLIWKRWYPDLHIVPIEATLVDSEQEDSRVRIASFFSGGVDSFFTILNHNFNSASGIQEDIDDLLCVWGFDVPLSNRMAFQQMLNTLQEVAFSFGKELIDVATNIKETRLNEAGWGPLYFGSALASVGLSLEKRYRKLLIASNGLGWDIPPLGSHPLTDPLYSTSHTKIVHDALVYTRLEKIKFISDYEIVRKSLRVCWESISNENCCECMKCYRTMTPLAVLGVLDKFTTFRKKSFGLPKIKQIYLSNSIERFFFNEIRALAVQKGRFDFVGAIDHSFKYSKHLSRLLPLIRTLKSKRFCYRISNLIERILLSETIV